MAQFYLLEFTHLLANRIVYVQTLYVTELAFSQHLDDIPHLLYPPQAELYLPSALGGLMRAILDSGDGLIYEIVDFAPDKVMPEIDIIIFRPILVHVDFMIDAAILVRNIRQK